MHHYHPHCRKNRRKHRRVFAYCLYLLIGANISFIHTSAQASSKIFTCVDDSGNKVFTDLGCPLNNRYIPPDTPAVDFAPLDPAETAQLKALSQRAATETAARRKFAQRQRRHQEKQANRRNASCQQATTALKQIANQRRKGYALAEQGALEQRQADLKARKRRDCS